jgi:hypothetical protein
MRMQKSLSDLEQAFAREVADERNRSVAIRALSSRRSVQREQRRVNRAGRLRYFILVSTLALTAVTVTITLFRLLYLFVG